MDNIGLIAKKPSINKDGKWNYLDVQYATQDEFNEATSKVMNALYKTNSDGKCLVLDNKGGKYMLELVHSTYDTINNIIRVFPISCRLIQDEKPAKQSK